MVIKTKIESLSPSVTLLSSIIATRHHTIVFTGEEVLSVIIKLIIILYKRWCPLIYIKMLIQTAFVQCLCISLSFSQSIQDMGNTKARQLYEANLPESFRRPQTDQYPSLSADVQKKNLNVLQYLEMLFILLIWCLFSLDSDLRAVEFFIRDKYEKKKYYSKNVTNGSSVCISSLFWYCRTPSILKCIFSTHTFKYAYSFTW